METITKELETANDAESVTQTDEEAVPRFESSSAESPSILISNPKVNTTNGSSNEDDMAGSKGQTNIPSPKLEDQGLKTFTMRELLKNDENGGDNHSSTPTSARGSQQQQFQLEQNNATMELINSVTTADEEGRSRQRILTYAAKRYASAIERNPGDYDALYNWALVLQESADNVSSESNSPPKDALLQEACKKYDEATRLNPQLHDAFYNWAIAISDRAKLRGRTMEAENLWKEATLNYEKAVKLNWNSPQALNNWGLALQELSAIVPAREKQTIVKTAISKFRAAIRLQFDFHRAIYNLGTVLYGLAEDTMRSGNSTTDNEFYNQSAIYIAAAHSLKPNYSVYSSALRLVRSMLPLPFLKVGSLTAAPGGNALAPHGEWKRYEFLLNHEGLKQATKDEGTEKKGIRVHVADIVSVAASGDLTLPSGPALAIDSVNGPLYLIADTWESLEGWLDAVRLVYTIYARGKSEVLAGVLTN